jgi:hypothetical protein
MRIIYTLSSDTTIKHIVEKSRLNHRQPRNYKLAISVHIHKLKKNTVTSSARQWRLQEWVIFRSPRQREGRWLHESTHALVSPTTHVNEGKKTDSTSPYTSLSSRQRRYEDEMTPRVPARPCCPDKRTKRRNITCEHVQLRRTKKPESYTL